MLASESRCCRALWRTGIQGCGALAISQAVVTRELWLLTHQELRHHARIGAVVAWLSELVEMLPAAA
jgi:hypothetical protein